MALGYAMKARPGPESATSAIDLLVTLAIKPRTENITKPDRRHVPSLNNANINVSLFINKIKDLEFAKI